MAGTAPPKANGVRDASSPIGRPRRPTVADGRRSRWITLDLATVRKLAHTGGRCCGCGGIDELPAADPRESQPVLPSPGQALRAGELIVTSNKSFVDWGEVFQRPDPRHGDPRWAAPPRHHRQYQGRRYRLREKKKAGLLGRKPKPAEEPTGGESRRVIRGHEPSVNRGHVTSVFSGQGTTALTGHWPIAGFRAPTSATSSARTTPGR